MSRIDRVALAVACANVMASGGKILVIDGLNDELVDSIPYIPEHDHQPECCIDERQSWQKMNRGMSKKQRRTL